MKRLLSFLCLLAFSTILIAQDGYQIDVTIDGFTQKELYLGYHYGDKQYLKDTVAVDANGVYSFKGEEALDCGIYLVVMPPDNKYFQILIDEEQHFSIKTAEADPVANMKVENSKDNKLFYDYLSFLGQQRPKAEALKKEREAAVDDATKQAAIDQKFENINLDVRKYQQDIIDNHPTTLTAALVKGGIELKIPEDITDEIEKYLFVKQNWFNNVDFSNPCLLRSNVLHTKSNYYIEKLTPQHPDSINQSVDYILEKAKENEDVFRYFLVHFLNKYASSKIVGMDAVYVHIVEQYYATGQAPWTDEEQLEKIIDNAKRLKPILIGKIAPDISVPELDIDKTLELKDIENEHKRFAHKDPITLSEVESPFTILFIWSPDCGHCKKSMPDMIKFYDEYKDKGVKMYAICHKNYKETPSCAEFLKERPEMLEWMNLNDPYFRSRYPTLYDVKSTPQLYILDEKKEIISKRIGAEQLPEVMEQLMKQKEKMQKEGMDGK